MIERTFPHAGGALTIRPLQGLEEYRACVALQEDTWGPGFSENVPVVILMVGQRLGGVSAGAFRADGRLEGFVFGLTGLEAGRPVHWSDMLAVRPELRNSGLGLALKAYQRDRLLALGVHRVYWTFDPLQSKNAWLNLGRLGAVSSEYVVDMYGQSGSPLHAGIGTDRLVVRWEITEARVAGRLSGREAAPPAETWADAPAVVDAESDPDAAPGPRVSSIPRGSPAITIAVPADIDALKASNPDMAVRWRVATRAAFKSALAQGYEVRELVRSGTVSRYVLVEGGEASTDPDRSRME